MLCQPPLYFPYFLSIYSYNSIPLGIDLLKCEIYHCLNSSISSVFLILPPGFSLIFSLLNSENIKVLENGLPNTFVPGRNLIFLNYAAIIAYKNKTKNIIAGMCETDFSGYPDCRNETITSMEKSLNLGMDVEFKIQTPLMFKSKAEIWQLIYEKGGKELIDIVIEESHTCYKGDRSKRFDWGYGCNSCPACELRSKGWNEFIINYPELEK